VAILITIAIMIFFDHGQPALLYLVPGVLLAVILTAYANGEVTQMWEHSEDMFIGAVKEEEEEEKKEEKEVTKEIKQD